MRKKLILSVFAASVLTAALTVVAARHHYVQPDKTRQVTVALINSRILAEQREILVHLPESYGREAPRRYPVLYVLDGGSHSDHTADSVRLLARIGAIPEMIVVGVPNGGDERRQRDYTPPYMHRTQDREINARGGADEFLEFLSAELLPYIDQNYRSTSVRMLAGNSRGGLFVLYSLLEEPNLFTARFAHSPALWRDDERIVAELTRTAALNRNRSFLYLSLGDGENAKMRRAFSKAVASLRADDPSGLRWRAHITTGADHENNAILATPVGLYEYSRFTASSE